MNKAILYKNLKIGESSFVEKVCDFIEYLFSMAEYMYNDEGLRHKIFFPAHFNNKRKIQKYEFKLFIIVRCHMQCKFTSNGIHLCAFYSSFKAYYLRQGNNMS